MSLPSIEGNSAFRSLEEQRMRLLDMCILAENSTSSLTNIFNRALDAPLIEWRDPQIEAALSLSAKNHTQIDNPLYRKGLQLIRSWAREANSNGLLMDLAQLAHLWTKGCIRLSTFREGSQAESLIRQILTNPYSLAYAAGILVNPALATLSFCLVHALQTPEASLQESFGSFLLEFDDSLSRNFEEIGDLLEKLDAHQAERFFRLRKDLGATRLLLEKAMREGFAELKSEEGRRFALERRYSLEDKLLHLKLQPQYLHYQSFISKKSGAEEPAGWLPLLFSSLKVFLSSMEKEPHNGALLRKEGIPSASVIEQAQTFPGYFSEAIDLRASPPPLPAFQFALEIFLKLAELLKDREEFKGELTAFGEFLAEEGRELNKLYENSLLFFKVALTAQKSLSQAIEADRLRGEEARRRSYALRGAHLKEEMAPFRRKLRSEGALRDARFPLSDYIFKDHFRSENFHNQQLDIIMQAYWAIEATQEQLERKMWWDSFFQSINDSIVPFPNWGKTAVALLIPTIIPLTHFGGAGASAIPNYTLEIHSQKIERIRTHIWLMERQARQFLGSSFNLRSLQGRVEFKPQGELGAFNTPALEYRYYRHPKWRTVYYHNLEQLARPMQDIFQDTYRSETYGRIQFKHGPALPGLNVHEIEPDFKIYFSLGEIPTVVFPENSPLSSADIPRMPAIEAGLNHKVNGLIEDYYRYLEGELPSFSPLSTYFSSKRTRLIDPLKPQLFPRLLMPENVLMVLEKALDPLMLAPGQQPSSQKMRFSFEALPNNPQKYSLSLIGGKPLKSFRIADVDLLSLKVFNSHEYALIQWLYAGIDHGGFPGKGTFALEKSGDVLPGWEDRFPGLFELMDRYPGRRIAYNSQTYDPGIEANILKGIIAYPIQEREAPEGIISAHGEEWRSHLQKSEMFKRYEDAYFLLKGYLKFSLEMNSREIEKEMIAKHSLMAPEMWLKAGEFLHQLLSADSEREESSSFRQVTPIAQRHEMEMAFLKRTLERYSPLA